MHRLTEADFCETEGHTLPMFHEPQPEPSTTDRVVDGLYWAGSVVLMTWLAFLCLSLAGCGGGDQQPEPAPVKCQPLSVPINKPATEYCA